MSNSRLDIVFLVLTEILFIEIVFILLNLIIAVPSIIRNCDLLVPLCNVKAEFIYVFSVLKSALRKSIFISERVLSFVVKLYNKERPQNFISNHFPNSLHQNNNIKI
jgi:hypothetical protein